MVSHTCTWDTEAGGLLRV
ncbi:rCG29994 [Rattus norvegicus]|uniref:RCG29994 n=1 Tax=Rattus norvegicus TaxID=10116 RepID=A6ILZ3_RAT|nr:rCG29994 [Rattus norvegicus]